MVSLVDNPVQALVAVGTENTQLHEELQRVYRELDWYRDALTYITAMPNAASPVAVKALQRMPYK